MVSLTLSHFEADTGLEWTQRVGVDVSIQSNGAPGLVSEVAFRYALRELVHLSLGTPSGKTPPTISQRSPR